MQRTAIFNLMSRCACLFATNIAMQFPLLNLFDMSGGVYGLAMVLAVVAVYALVIGCFYFPSRQAAWIYPAKALREE